MHVYHTIPHNLLFDIFCSTPCNYAELLLRIRAVTKVEAQISQNPNSMEEGSNLMVTFLLIEAVSTDVVILDIPLTVYFELMPMTAGK